MLMDGDARDIQQGVSIDPMHFVIYENLAKAAGCRITDTKKICKS